MRHGSRIWKSQFRETFAMLRITHQIANDSTVSLKLEGKLLKPWLGELQRSIVECAAQPNALRLDLSALTYADAAGTQALAELIRDGAIPTAYSGYIAALFGVDDRRG